MRGTRGFDLSLAARGKMGFADNPERNEANSNTLPVERDAGPEKGARPATACKSRATVYKSPMAAKARSVPVEERIQDLCSGLKRYAAAFDTKQIFIKSTGGKNE